MKQKFIDGTQKRLQGMAAWPGAEVASFALVTELIPELCRVPYDYLLRDDPEGMAECTLLVQEYLDVDMILANLDVYNFEAEAMGAEVKFYPDHCADIVRSNYFIKGPQDLDKIKFKGLDTGRFPYLLRYCRAYKKYTGAETFPMSLADAFASVPVVTPAIVREFIKPSLERELEKLDMPGIVLQDTAFFGTAQLSGAARKEYEDFIVWSNNMFFCIDPDLTELTPEYAREVANAHGVPLMAGIAAKQVEFGEIPETVSIIKDFVLKGKKGPSPLIFFFNNLSPRTSTDKLLAATRAVRVFGRPEADENTAYEIPENISFEKFLEDKMKNNPEGYTFHWLEKSGYAGLRK